MKPIINVLNMFFLCGLAIVNVSCGQGKDKNVIQMIEKNSSKNYRVQPVSYVVDNVNNIEEIEYMLLSKRDNRYECSIKLKNRDAEEGEVWIFDLTISGMKMEKLLPKYLMCQSI